MHVCPISLSATCRIIKKGTYKRRSSPHRAKRYYCKTCRKGFCDRYGGESYRERKTHLRNPLAKLLYSGVSQRRCALMLGIHQTTVARKKTRLARQAARENRYDREHGAKVWKVVFDEMESFEHTKCKPLSMAIAVEHKSRRILSVQVAKMPAKGLLAKTARRKYGFRPDERGKGLDRLMDDIAVAVAPDVSFRSDECPRYPGKVAKWFQGASHRTYKGRRGCVVGQGELKRGGFDPLFSLNHTAAMYRCNVKRLARKTWCTTKKAECLLELMELYTWYHNRRLINKNKLPYMKLMTLRCT